MQTTTLLWILFVLSLSNVIERFLTLAWQKQEPLGRILDVVFIAVYAWVAVSVIHALPPPPA